MVRHNATRKNKGRSRSKHGGFVAGVLHQASVPLVLGSMNHHFGKKHHSSKKYRGGMKRRSSRNHHGGMKRRSSKKRSHKKRHSHKRR